MTWTISNVRTQRGKDVAVLSIYIPISLGMVVCGKVVLDGHDTTHVLEELQREAYSVFYEFLRRTIFEHSRVHEVLGYFGG